MFKLKYDGTSEYDWYYYAGSSSGMRLETVPGCSIWDNSPWKNYKLGAAFYVESPGTYRWLDDYDNPDTVDGWGSASASASCQIGPFGSSYSYSYNIPYMTVVNYGQLDLHKAAWLSTHNVLLVADDPSCTNAFMNRPSFVVRTTQNTWSWVNAQFMVTWMHITMEIAGNQPAVIFFYLCEKILLFVNKFIMGLHLSRNSDFSFQ
jgi:hypothetical protein